MYIIIIKINEILNTIFKIKYDVNFTRVGSYERTHQEIRKYDSSIMTANIDTVEGLKRFYDEIVNIDTFSNKRSSLFIL